MCLQKVISKGKVSNKQKQQFFVGILKATEEKTRIRSRIQIWIRNPVVRVWDPIRHYPIWRFHTAGRNDKKGWGFKQLIERKQGIFRMNMMGEQCPYSLTFPYGQIRYFLVSPIEPNQIVCT